MDEVSRLKELEQQNHRLKEALANSHMDQELLKAHLDIACRALGTDTETFKKKHGPKPSDSVSGKDEAR